MEKMFQKFASCLLRGFRVRRLKCKFINRGVHTHHSLRVRVSVGIMICLPSREGSRATVAYRSLGIINSTYSAITGPRTSHRQISHVRRNSISAQREYSFPHFPSVVPLELL